MLQTCVLLKCFADIISCISHSYFVGEICLICYQVCDCQHQFARWEDGQQRPLPIFSGSRGPEFSSALLEIECSFHLSLQKLRSCDKAILDILNIKWCSEFNK